MHMHPSCEISWAHDASLLGTLYLDGTVRGQSLFSRCIRRIQKLAIVPRWGPQGRISTQRLIKRAEEELRYWDYEYEVQNKKSNERQYVVGEGCAGLSDRYCRWSHIVSSLPMIQARRRQPPTSYSILRRRVLRQCYRVRRLTCKCRPKGVRAGQLANQLYIFMKLVYTEPHRAD